MLTIMSGQRGPMLTTPSTIHAHRTTPSHQASVDRDIRATVSMGATMEADARFGVDWTDGNGWDKIAEANMEFTYWEPQWDFGIGEAGTTPFFFYLLFFYLRFLLFRNTTSPRVVELDALTDSLC